MGQSREKKEMSHALTKSSALFTLTRNFPLASRAMSSDGSAGAIREAGGSFGKKAADEERYFRKLQAEQLQVMKKHLDEEISFHQEQIKSHKESVEAHERRIAELNAKKPK